MMPMANQNMMNTAQNAHAYSTASMHGQNMPSFAIAGGQNTMMYSNMMSMGPEAAHNGKTFLFHLILSFIRSLTKKDVMD